MLKKNKIRYLAKYYLVKKTFFNLNSGNTILKFYFCGGKKYFLPLKYTLNIT